LKHNQKHSSELSVVHKLLTELKENASNLENQLLTEVKSPSHTNSETKINNKKHHQFLTVIRQLKHETQQQLVKCLKDYELNADCKQLKQIINHAHYLLQHRNELQSMLVTYNEKIVSLKINAKREAETSNNAIAICQKKIELFKKDIQHLQQKIEIDQQLEKCQLTAKLNTDRREQRFYSNLLESKLATIQQQISIEQETATATKKYLQTKLNNLDLRLQTEQTRYDSDVTENKRKLEQVRLERDQNLQQLQACEIQYNEEKTMWDARIEAERKNEELEARVHTAAITIQRITRGFLVRLRIKQAKQEKMKKKGKKGGKGKGKKGKKGKK
jgi:hypothetical protein